MHQRVGAADERIIGFRLSGEVTAEDVQEMERIVQEACEKFGKIRMLVELAELEVDDPTAYWDTFKIAREHGEDVERVAIVGDKAWEKSWIGIGGMWVESDVRYFDHGQLEDAWDWIRK
jgi:hypothetical protein